MTNFDRRQLRYFVAVAEELHFGNAARRLHISQPPLSQQIAALEGDLGIQLFVRTKRKVEITAAGQQLLDDARRILSEMDRIAARAQAAAAGQTGLLRVGLNYSAPISPMLPALTRRFTKLYPQVRLELHENTSAKQIEGLLNNTLDLCFIWPTREDASPELTLLPLSQDELRLVVAKDHPLGVRPKLMAKDFDKVTVFLTLRQTRMNLYDTLMEACRKVRATPIIRTDIIQMPFIMNVVAAGQGVGFIPEFFNRIRPAGTLFRKCGFLPYAAKLFPLSLIYRTHDKSPLVKNFVSTAREFISTNN